MEKTQQFIQQRLAGLIRLYQSSVGLLLIGRCRFHPTCSHYALQALGCYSLPKSLWLIMTRLLRCHPFAHGGEDPLPQPPQAKV